MTAFRQSQASATLGALEAFFTSGSAPPPTPEGKVLALFHEAARDVPAYARFLHEHGVEPARVDGIEAFRRVPVTTKDNYYRKHPLPDLCRHGRLESCDMVALSTGST